MFKEIMIKLREALAEPNIYSSLEAFVTANNPQSDEEVRRLEQEFERRQQMNFFGRYF